MADSTSVNLFKLLVAALTHQAPRTTILSEPGNFPTDLYVAQGVTRLLPGRVRRVQHEAVVDDLDGQVRRILAHCGLPFEAACLDFHRTRRSVRTPSSEQVRQPIFRDGLDQWRRFEPWLEPLRTALGDAVATYKD